MTTAMDLAEKLKAHIAQALIQAGHSACRENERARYDFARQVVICGCGRETGVTPFDGGVPDPGQPERATGQLTDEPHLGTEVPGELVPNGMADPVRPNLATLDPTVAYTPVDLEMRILDVLSRLEYGAIFERHWMDQATAAHLAWYNEYWRVYEASEKPSADRREAEARLVTADLMAEKVKAEAMHGGAKAAMHNLRSVLSGYQSVARSVGLDYQAGGANR